ncbi:hypothetical protein JYT83_01350 [bacterium AH-315-F18]|nr:hypothetical protein [bacterium AH-315-F18]
MEDLAGLAHFSAIVLAPVAAAFIFSARKQRPTPQKYLLAVTGSGFLMLLAFLFTTHHCGRGTPVLQVIIPAISLAIAIAYARPDVVGVLAQVLLAVCAIFLPFHYSEIVHDPPYLGAPGFAEWRNGVNAHILKGVVAELRENSHKQSGVIEAGWIGTESFSDYFSPEQLESFSWGLTRFSTQPLWHTPITGLHFVSEVQVGLWYPGGPLETSIGRISFKPLPAETIEQPK